MLEQIQDDNGDVEKYVNMAKDKDNGFRLMGFGHRVYKNFDPRATIIKKACDKLLNKLQTRRSAVRDRSDNWKKLLWKTSTLSSENSIPTSISIRVSIYRAMGIPVKMFTVLFAMGRLPGWIAHWKEMHESPTKRICRPRQIYTGATVREFVPIEKR